MEEATKDMAVSVSADIGANLNELILKLSDTIGVTADKVFPWYVKQSLIEANVFIVLITALGLLAVIWLFSSMIIFFKNESETSFLSLVISGMVLAGVVFVGCMEMSTAIGKILTPELFAVKAMVADMKQFIR